MPSKHPPRDYPFTISAPLTDYISPASMTVTQYLGTGSVSRGRMVITRQLNTVVSVPPYLRDPDDKAAVVQGLINLQESLRNVQGLTWVNPRPGVTAQQFVDSVS